MDGAELAKVGGERVDINLFRHIGHERIDPGVCRERRKPFLTTSNSNHLPPARSKPPRGRLTNA
ncbi:hypothetical protein GCM10009655_14460 [Rhodoglobus aureus]|uniref:Uncharacterized protein n=1 Tax=Rhodoglobus aureus TaxID=191497 RepID=A0ABP4G8W1_9MICO